MVRPGQGYLNLGTSANLAVLSPGGHRMGMATASTGSALDWMIQTIAAPELAQAEASGKTVFEAVNAMVALSPPGCHGVLFHPYAANNICKGIQRYAKAGKTKLGGLICNSRLVDREQELVEAFAKKLGTRLIHLIPRDNTVQHAEIQRKTVIAFDRDSRQAEQYRALARAVEGNTAFTVPSPLTNDELEALLQAYAVSC